jgi:hypothetical protein
MEGEHQAGAGPVRPKILDNPTIHRPYLEQGEGVGQSNGQRDTLVGAIETANLR